MKIFLGRQIMESDIILQRMEKTGLVPVVVIENVEDAVPTAKALLEGGIDMMEITFRTACAKDAIAKVKEEVPGMLVGAGTILDIRQAKEAVSAGAEFIVSPGTRMCHSDRDHGGKSPRSFCREVLPGEPFRRDQSDQDTFRCIPRYAVPSDWRR